MIAEGPSLPPVAAELRQADGLSLWVDPIALAALEAAQMAGMTKPTDIPMLPEAEDLPLRVVCVEARLDAVERALARIDRLTRAAFEDLGADG